MFSCLRHTQVRIRIELVQSLERSIARVRNLDIIDLKMRSMGRKSSPCARLWSKAKNVVSALGAFQRPYSNVTRSAGMTESMSPPRKRSKKGCIALGACLVFVVLVLINGTAFGLISLTEPKKHHSGGGDGDPDAFSVTGICSRTLYPDVCNNTLSGSDTSNLQNCVVVAMEAAMVAISKSVEAAQELESSSPVKNGIQYSTLQMCHEVLGNCLEQVNTSLSLVSNLNQQSLKPELFGDIQTYMSAALTDQDTCVTGVQDFGVWKVSDALNGTHGTLVTKLLGNALSLLNSLGQALHHNRRRLLHFHDMEGDFPHWISRERRRLLQSSNPRPNAVVAKDGSERYTSIQAAVDAAPSGSRWVIYVKRGVYREYVSVSKDKKNLMMYGDGPGQTVITGSKSVKGTGAHTFSSATFAVDAPGFIATDMTIQNTAGAAGEQAVALRAGGDQQAFSNVNLEGYQDTLYAHVFRQFYTKCTIIGTIDYIFGNAAAVFQNCNLQARLGRPGSQNTYTASGRMHPEQKTGLSFLSCTVGAAPGLPDSYPTYLGRPWKPYAQTVFIKSSLANCVNPAGWLLWNGDPKSAETVNYGEYGNTGPGSNTASRVSWSRQISTTEATEFTRHSLLFFAGWRSPKH